VATAHTEGSFALRLTSGQVHDSQDAEALLGAMPEGATLLAAKAPTMKLPLG
jgi:hypothetical protein